LGKVTGTLLIFTNPAKPITYPEALNTVDETIKLNPESCCTLNGKTKRNRAGLPRPIKRLTPNPESFAEHPICPLPSALNLLLELRMT
jgi:hypothetical protein